jgi:predicted ATP-grasp superfamily ATP-dependent carboligase
VNRGKSGTPTLLVTDAGRGSAIAFIRSLGRKGWRVIAADSDPRSPGFRSRYAWDRLLYPAPETAPREFVQTVLQTVREKSVDLIVPVTDAAIFPLSEARSQFEGLCELAMSDATALEVVTNKLKTLELAERLGVPTPYSVLVHTAQEAVERWQGQGWPVVLKPRASRLYRERAAVEAFTVTYAGDSAELARQMQRFEGRCPVLLQEYYSGEGHGVELLMHQGRPLAAFQHKRLREVPLNGGASAFRESVPLDAKMYDDSVRLLEALNWTGLAMVEFKVGEAGPKLMEINGRVWGSLPLAVRSGVDFPAGLAELYLYGPPKNGAAPSARYAVGVRARNLELDMVWIASVLRGKRRYSFLQMPSRWQGLGVLLDLLNPAYKFDILSLEDLRPGLAEISKIIHKFSHKIQEDA